MHIVAILQCNRLRWIQDLFQGIVGGNQLPTKKSSRCHLAKNTSETLHPGKLTWNQKMVNNKVWKMIFLFTWVIFVFHVNLRVSVMIKVFHPFWWLVGGKFPPKLNSSLLTMHHWHHNSNVTYPRCNLVGAQGSEMMRPIEPI